ncbi:transcriptional regulator [Caulobacter segnis]|uniref:Transcriptional regulator, Crp/Fnr family n=2 Tax=Caulobacter segnis TaxID=88688 RepID=D5VJE3_CAUST|nr:cyclic nucleotide-binding domain-containing protein [Caulobacter segnis]ADG10352.1 transcriptional regulator, Crp/Fnr family [Caulobacter segnis ATCC 21756]AVQ02085.1 transcriptional regulator [Caulobacter segnis]
MSIKPIDLSRVRDLPLLASASEESLSLIGQGGFLQWTPKGAELVAEGEVNDFLYILLDGSVELEGTWGDRDSTLAVLRPLSSFVLASVVLEAPALMTARTLSRSQLLMIPGDLFRRVMREDRGVSLAVIEELSGCYSGLVRTIKSHKLRAPLVRLANYLLVQQQRQGGGVLRLPLQKRMLASLLGMTPENLSRSFAALAEYGVRVDGPLVTITRPAVLARLAKPDPLIDNPLPVAGAMMGQAGRERAAHIEGRA